LCDVCVRGRKKFRSKKGISEKKNEEGRERKSKKEQRVYSEGEILRKHRKGCPPAYDGIARPTATTVRMRGKEWKKKRLREKKIHPTARTHL